MILGMVAGTVVTSQKADGIEGAKYLLVERCSQGAERRGEFHVALDQIGAGVGEMIFMSQGSPNRQTPRTFDKPVDATVIGIVDLIDECGEVVYDKSQG